MFLLSGFLYLWSIVNKSMMKYEIEKGKKEVRVDDWCTRWIG